MKNKYNGWLVIILIMINLSVSIAGDMQKFKSIERNDESFKNELSKYFRSYKVYELNSKVVSDYINSQPGKAIFNISFGNNNYDMQMQLNEMRSDGFKAVSIGNEGETIIPSVIANTYKGFLLNNEKDFIRLTIDDGLFEGYINKEAQRICFDKLSRYDHNADKNLIVCYYPEDIIDNGKLTCGFQETQHELENLNQNKNGNPKSMLTGNCHFLEIATEADYVYFQSCNSNAAYTLSNIRSILNQVEGDYTASFNVKFILTYQQVWSTINDPYVPVGSVLDQFKDWWNVNKTGIVRDVTHMFTGIGGDTGWGQARPSGTCSVTDRYSVIGTLLTQPNLLTLNLSRHELGHNFGAGHDTINGCSTIMCPYVGNLVMPWSFVSTLEITNFITASGSCLTETFPFDRVINGLPFGSVYGNLKAVATNNITMQNGTGLVQFANTSYGYIECGNTIVLTPGVANFDCFFVPEGANLVMRISDVSNTCDVLQRKGLEASDATKDFYLKTNPNPANDFITFNINGADSKTTFNIYNSTMQLVKTLNFDSGFENTISTTDFTNGIYFIDAQSGGQSYKAKFVVSR